MLTALNISYIMSSKTTQIEAILDNLLSGIISSKTRIKLLMRFFFNPKTRSYLRELAKEFNVSSNAVREELNQLTSTNLLNSEKNGRQVYYTANTDHTLFPELKSMVGKVMGIDKVIDGIVSRLGELEQAYLIDDYAEGKDTGIIDILLVGNIDQYHLNDLSRKTERYIKRKIRALVLTREEFNNMLPQLKERPQFLIWEGKNRQLL
jgi:predicted transcriptional regulator